MMEITPPIHEFPNSALAMLRPSAICHRKQFHKVIRSLSIFQTKLISYHNIVAQVILGSGRKSGRPGRNRLQPFWLSLWWAPE